MTAAKRGASPIAGPTRMLFVGNSYTARHDLPALVAQLGAEATPRVSIETQAITAGGASLRRHWNAGTVHAALRASSWHYVVLQEQSTLPMKNPARYRLNVAEFIPTIRGHGATAVLYLTWAWRDVPQMHDATTLAIERTAAEFAARVVPVGLAWQVALRECPDVELYMRDGSHPTAAGAYLSACVFLTSLFGVALGTLSTFAPRWLDPLTARRLQGIAGRFTGWMPPPIAG